jgi:metal-responsive CopG/Arc/MetJ family transcriptional regulator
MPREAERISIWIDSVLYQAIKSYSKDNDYSTSETICAAIREFLKARE